MNHDTLGLIVFAFCALAAVYAFIFVLGGPEAEKTGQLFGIKPTSSFESRGAEAACRAIECEDGLDGIPTGRYDPVRELYECRCKTSNQNSLFYRSAYARTFR